VCRSKDATKARTSSMLSFVMGPNEIFGVLGILPQEKGRTLVATRRREGNVDIF